MQTGLHMCCSMTADYFKETVFYCVPRIPIKYPLAMNFVDSLPKTEKGKIQRFKLRQV